MKLSASVGLTSICRELSDIKPLRLTSSISKQVTLKGDSELRQSSKLDNDTDVFFCRGKKIVVFFLLSRYCIFYIKKSIKI